MGGLFFGIAVGILLGVGLGLTIVMLGICSSNDLGDSKASFRDFSASAEIRILGAKDKVPKKEYTKIVHINHPETHW